MIKQATLIALTLLATAPALAKDAPVPSKKRMSLETIEKELSHEKEKEQKIAEDLKETQHTLKQVKAKMVALAHKTQTEEKELSSLETRIANISNEIESLTTDLENNYGSMGTLVTALIHLRKTPPEALIAKPGTPLEAAQTAMILQDVLPHIQKQTKDMEATFLKLHTLEKELRQDHKKIIEVKQTYETQKADMDMLLNQRKTLYTRLQKGQEESQKRIKSLSKEATNLKDLLAKLDAEQKRKETRQKTQQAYKKLPASQPPQFSNLRLPVSGYIKTGFGQEDDIGARNEGITILSRPQALIVAPIEGIVQFADTFQNYGRLVILKHSGNYHSLISGFDRFDVNVGDHVKAGEPLGILPLKSSRGSNPALYYELRLNGKPINPAIKLAKR